MHSLGEASTAQAAPALRNSGHISRPASLSAARHRSMVSTSHPCSCISGWPQRFLDACCRAWPTGCLRIATRARNLACPLTILYHPYTHACPHAHPVPCHAMDGVSLHTRSVCGHKDPWRCTRGRTRAQDGKERSKNGGQGSKRKLVYALSAFIPPSWWLAPFLSL